jgi:heme oxygenase
MLDADRSALVAPRRRLAVLLREETAAQHAAVERLPVMERLTSAGVTSADYLAYLSLLAEVYAALEPGLLDRVDADLRQAAGLRCKLPAILADLATHGRAAPTLTERIPQPASLASTVGGLYVLEGATLGGRVIAKHLRRCLGPALGPTSFLDFHGDEASMAWKRFIGVIEGLAEAGRVDAEEVLAGARGTFDSVHRILAGGRAIGVESTADETLVLSEADWRSDPSRG